jgi:hypothetical protein
MSESSNKQQVRSTKYVSLEKSADILQGAFKHYYEMAMDHHTKAGTTSNMLLIIVGAIIGLIGFDNKIGGIMDLAGGFAVLIIGIFGAVWAWKQHERYCYWEHIAYEYQEELIKITPELKTAQSGKDYARHAQDAAAKKFGAILARRIDDLYLWVFLHCIVAAIGIMLITVSI